MTTTTKSINNNNNNNNNNVIVSGEAEETALNLFARGRLARSPFLGTGVSTSKQMVGRFSGGARGGTAPSKEAQMIGADVTRVLNRNRSGLPKIYLVAEQLNKMIGYTSNRATISKDLKQDLKQDLLKLRKSLALAKKKYDLLVE